MRYLGVRRSAAVLGLGFRGAGRGLVGGGRSGPAAMRYELSAPLLATGGRVSACFSDVLRDRVTHCGGIEVKGVDVSQVPAGGGDPPWSQTMRLVGTWDGHGLTLTEAPRAAQTPPGLPPLCSQDFNPQPVLDTTQRQIEVIDALRSRGIEVLMSTGCDRATDGVLVVVADEATLHWIARHYH